MKILDKGEFIFVPAISEEILNKYKLGLNWWKPDAPFQHKAGLLSAYWLYWRTGENYKNFRSEIQFPSNYLFIMDSGGYQLYSQKSSPDYKILVKKLTPEKVVEIQEANADIGFILDEVPYQRRPYDRFYYDPVFFKQKMEITAKNTAIAIDKHKRNPESKMELYGVIQGKEYDHLMTWWKTMKEYEADLDGWALSPKPWTLEKTAMYILFIIEQDINVPVHFLGIGAEDALALIIYLLRKDKNGVQYFSHRITADSTSYNLGATKAKIFGKDPSVCDCPLTNLHDLYKSKSEDSGIALSLHNLYYQHNLIQTLTSLIVKDPKKYIEHVLAKSGERREEMEFYFKHIDSIIAKKRG